MSTSLQFGYVDINEQSPSKTFTIRNRGQKHLKITGIEVTPKESEDKIAVSPSLTSLAGTILEPDGSVTVTTRVVPTDFKRTTVSLKVYAAGLTEADAIANGIDTELISPTWRKSATLDVAATVSGGDAQFYEGSGTIVIKSTDVYDLQRITTRGMYQRIVRIKKVSGTGPVIIKAWDDEDSGETWNVTRSTHTFPVYLNNVGDYQDFTYTFTPIAANEMHISIGGFTYYELGQTKFMLITAKAKTQPQQLSFYAYGYSPGETYDFGNVFGAKRSMICTIENTGDIPLNVTEVWLSTSSTGSGSRAKSTTLGDSYRYGIWSISAASGVEGSEVPPGVTRAFIVNVENPNVYSTSATNGTPTLYAFVETDSDTNPIQKVTLKATIVR